MTTKEAFSTFINISLRGEARKGLAFDRINWKELLELSLAQGVLAIVWNGIEIQSCEGNLPISVADKMLWHGMVRKSEGEMNNMRKQAEDFAELISPLPCIVLKGFDYARYWPSASQRVFGDLDIWSCGNQDKINHAVTEAGGTAESDNDSKHNEIHYNGLRVENHRYFVSDGKTLREHQIEDLLCDTIGNDFTAIDGSKLLYPNANFSVLMMLRHVQNHFLYEGVRLRLVLDWHFFMKKEKNNIDWESVTPAMKTMNIAQLAELLTQFCEVLEGKREKNDRLQRFEDLLFEPEMDRRLTLIPSIVRVYKRCIKRWQWRHIL